ncbi:hypothetical protein [Tumebacillus lipolyticus]|uniref:Uncharacterized protein n=1 Tax=Tumebacillus lipolyticus TaxID=1280370 RepID=A0ABW4ZRZ3_9BACL
MKFEFEKYDHFFAEKIEMMKEKESDDYKLRLLNRITSSMDAARLLIGEGFFVEAPALHCVAFEHSVRLAYVDQNPNIFQERPNAFKILVFGLELKKDPGKSRP